MKTRLFFLLCSLIELPALAQTVNPPLPGQPVVDDSAGHSVSPGVRRMGTDFYRRAGDPRDVMRATLDNMPVKTPRRDQEYSMLNPQLSSPYRYKLPLPDSLRLRFRRRP